MALKNRMLCYVMGTLAAGATISLALNVGILLAAFPDWIDNVGAWNRGCGDCGMVCLSAVPPAQRLTPHPSCDIVGHHRS